MISNSYEIVLSDKAPYLNVYASDCKSYMMFPFVMFPPPHYLRQYLASFAVTKGWLLLDIGWFVLFFYLVSNKIPFFVCRYCSILCWRWSDGENRRVLQRRMGTIYTFSKQHLNDPICSIKINFKLNSKSPYMTLYCIYFLKYLWNENVVCVYWAYSLIKRII